MQVHIIIWEEVQKIMEKSVRGTHPSTEELHLLQSALKLDRGRYRALHDQVKEVAGKEVMGL